MFVPDHILTYVMTWTSKLNQNSACQELQIRLKKGPKNNGLRSDLRALNLKKKIWGGEGPPLARCLLLHAVYSAEPIQFCFRRACCVVDTTQEDWSEEKEVREKFVVTIPPGGCVYFWQYTLGIGNEDILHTKYVIMTDTGTPPTEVPLPSSKF